MSQVPDWNAQGSGQPNPVAAVRAALPAGTAVRPGQPAGHDDACARLRADSGGSDSGRSVLRPPIRPRPSQQDPTRFGRPPDWVLFPRLGALHRHAGHRLPDLGRNLLVQGPDPNAAGSRHADLEAADPGQCHLGRGIPARVVAHPVHHSGHRVDHRDCVILHVRREQGRRALHNQVGGHDRAARFTSSSASRSTGRSRPCCATRPSPRRSPRRCFSSSGRPPSSTTRARAAPPGGP